MALDLKAHYRRISWARNIPVSEPERSTCYFSEAYSLSLHNCCWGNFASLSFDQSHVSGLEIQARGHYESAVNSEVLPLQTQLCGTITISQSSNPAISNNTYSSWPFRFVLIYSTVCTLLNTIHDYTINYTSNRSSDIFHSLYSIWWISNHTRIKWISPSHIYKYIYIYLCVCVYKTNSLSILVQRREYSGKIMPIPACWFPGPLRLQDISSHGINYGNQTRPVSSTRKYFPYYYTFAMWGFINDRIFLMQIHFHVT